MRGASTESAFPSVAFPLRACAFPPRQRGAEPGAEASGAVLGGANPRESVVAVVVGVVAATCPVVCAGVLKPVLKPVLKRKLVLKPVRFSPPPRTPIGRFGQL